MFPSVLSNFTSYSRPIPKWPFDPVHCQIQFQSHELYDFQIYYWPATKAISDFLSRVFMKCWRFSGHTSVHREDKWSKCTMFNIYNLLIILSLFVFFMFNENSFSWYVDYDGTFVLFILTSKKAFWKSRKKNLLHLRQVLNYHWWVLLQFFLLLAAMQARFQRRCRFLSEAVLQNFLLYCFKS